VGAGTKVWVGCMRRGSGGVGGGGEGHISYHVDQSCQPRLGHLKGVFDVKDAKQACHHFAAQRGGVVLRVGKEGEEAAHHLALCVERHEALGWVQNGW
jgi:hypothetical protein